jgi:PadR family transcriptional regulator PadR
MIEHDGDANKWEAQLRKGCLEMAVLMALCAGRSYGLGILRVLESDSNLVLSEGTIYPILNRLRQEGMVNSEWVEAEAGHPRRYYSLTQKGRARAIQMARTWLDFAAGLNRLAKPLAQEREETA